MTTITHNIKIRLYLTRLMPTTSLASLMQTAHTASGLTPFTAGSWWSTCPITLRSVF
jgi:hypothetical protein